VKPGLGGIAFGDVGSRVERVRARLAEKFSAQAMLVSSPANIRYLTGFTGASTGLLLLPDRFVLVTDDRYRARALHTVCAPHLSHNGAEVVTPPQRADMIRRFVPKSERLVIEADNVSLADYKRLSADLIGVDLVPAHDIVLEERLVKDAGEIARIRAAGAISDAAVEDLVAAEPLGWSELEVAAFLLERMTAIGAERAAFEPIVATGERSALAHPRLGSERLEENMILLIDFGAEVDGYKADTTRTLWWGELPKDLETAFDAVREAYDAAVGTLKPGVMVEAVDGAARSVLREYELERFVVHPSGHNVGLEIHERPFLGQGYPGELATGNVVTIEPGVYIPDVGGVRLEDTFVVTDAGPVALTTSMHGGQIDRRRAGELSDGAGGTTSSRGADTRVEWDETQFSGKHPDAQKVDDHRRFLVGDGASQQSAYDAGGETA
jgi:Xaa-Pro aminopeptidase